MGSEDRKKLPDTAFEDTLKADDVVEIIPVKRNYCGETVHILFSVLTLGLVSVILYWRKKVWKSVRWSETSVEEASYILIISNHGEEHLAEKSVLNEGSGKESRPCISFRFRRYTYEGDSWKVVRNRLHKKAHNKLVEMSARGLTSEQVKIARDIYGANSTHVPQDNLFYTILSTLEWFNYYQVAAVVIWCFREYYIYAAVIFVLALGLIIYQVYTVRIERSNLNKFTNDNVKVLVFRDNKPEPQEIPAKDLVPGDLVELGQDMPVTCDIVLLHGHALVNEAVLTGESMPVNKEDLPNDEEYFNPKLTQHMLFHGSQVLTSTNVTKDDRARGLVYQTGFNTSKGTLLREVMFEDPGIYKAEKHVNYFLLMLFFMGIVLMLIYYIIAMATFWGTINWVDHVFPSVDLLLLMLPPGLFVSVIIGVEQSQIRLRKLNIVVPKARIVKGAGRMDVVYFDKTGTLTSDTMSLHKFFVCKNKTLTHVEDFERKEFEDVALPCLANFATNHNVLNIMKQLLGDPMECELFRFSEATFTEEEFFKKAFGVIGVDIDNDENEPPNLKRFKLSGKLERELHVLKYFDFNSETKRMSVVVKDAKTSEGYIFTKGAAEVVAELCDKSTLPDNLNMQIAKAAKSGFRVLGFAYKRLESAKGKKVT